MAEKLVAVHVGMTGPESESAVQLSSVLMRGAGTVFGTASDDAIRAMRDDGIIVSEWGDPINASAPPAGVRRGSRKSARPGPAGPSPYVATLVGPLFAPWRAALEGAGAKLLARLSPTELLIRIDRPAWNELIRMEFIRGLRAYERPIYGPALSGDADSERSAPSVRRARGATPRGAAEAELDHLDAEGSDDSASEETLSDIILLPESTPDAVVNWLTGAGVQPIAITDRKVRVRKLDVAMIAALKRFADVESVERYVLPKLLAERARSLAATDVAPPAGLGATSKPYGGAGQVIAVADSGVDVDHPDFAGRVIACESWGRANDCTDPSGHGTHVAGIALGDGAASGGIHAGVAPLAGLIVQSLADVHGKLTGIPPNVGELLDHAYKLGARIHNDSWGASVAARYPSMSLEVDTFVHKYPDFLVVLAAGNDGDASKPIHSAPGQVDWLSLSAPGTSKNGLVIGASRSDRAVGGYAEHTYEQIWPRQFPRGGVGDDHVSGDPARLAAFSSRGPCDDGRIKPDLVAPGTDVLSTRSKIASAPTWLLWADGPTEQYAFSGGTSMAAPVVSGCAAIVREHLQSVLRHQPSSALVKAILVNGATKLVGPDAVADYAQLPNMHQGFGAVNLARSLALDGGRSSLALVDTYAPVVPTEECVLEETDSFAEWEIELVEAGEFRCCLAYTDWPGRGLQNNLNLSARPAAYSRKRSPWIGNADRPRKLKDIDVDNNVEIIRVDSVPAGLYRITVSAENLFKRSQHYALAVLSSMRPGSRLRRVN